MPSLDQYINFSTVLDKSQPSPLLKLIDGGSYPIGVTPTITGYFTVTQPDSLSVQVGSFASPSIFWDSGALVQPTTELRLNTANTFQSGNYVISYYIQAPGYDDTILTKEFNLNYIAPIQTIVKAFDLFTPDLSVTDATTYGQSGMSLSAIARTWAGTVISVLGTDQNISGAGVDFDLNYLGNYYDSRYDVTLTSNPQYVLSSPDDWVTIIDELVVSQTYYAEIPPTLEVLLNDLTTLKYSIDTCICGKNCGCTECQLSKSNYMLAVSIYTHLVERGRIDDVSGLSLYVLQLQKIFNNCITPTYINTNEVIPAYNFGGGSGGSVAWNDITGKPSTATIEWTVGALGFPGAGATTLTDARLANIPVARVLVFRNNALQYSSNQGSGNTYFTKASTAANSIMFSAALFTEEEMIVIILPL